MNVQGQTGRMTSRGFKAEGKRNEEQEKLFQEVQAERERLNLLKKERDAQKDAVDERMKKELEALKESTDYYSIKTVGGGRKKRTVRQVTEEGKQKKKKLKSKAGKKNSD